MILYRIIIFTLTICASLCAVFGPCKTLVVLVASKLRYKP